MDNVLQNIGFSQCCIWGFKSSGMTVSLGVWWHNISKKCCATLFRSHEPCYY